MCGCAMCVGVRCVRVRSVHSVCGMCEHVLVCGVCRHAVCVGVRCAQTCGTLKPQESHKDTKPMALESYEIILGRFIPFRKVWAPWK